MWVGAVHGSAHVSNWPRGSVRSVAKRASEPHRTEPRHHYMQLYMGHVLLNYFLHKINKAESSVCPTCQLADETVHHYLFNCPGFVYERHSLAQAMGCNSKSI